MKLNLVFMSIRHYSAVPLTGTTSAKHMREDLDIYDFELLGGGGANLTLA